MGSKSSTTTTMEDVDRLFECFKCGISPPQSAVRERKRSKGIMKKQGISIHEASPGSAEQPKKKIASNAVEGKNVSQGKQISPVVFYGSPHGVPPKRPISLLRLLREIRIDLAEQQKSHLSKEAWATFPRQNEAMNFAKEHADKFVLKVLIQDQKIMAKIIKTTISLAGVDSISVNSEENKLVVIGDGIDAIDLVIKLRNFCDAELISLGPAGNEKKIEPDNDHAIRYQNALAEWTKSYQAYHDRYFGAITAEDDRKACVIM